ncbi:hypothetical protein CALCODRAFT_188357 [Calocera cornea HHB12733]|uniref:Uncharacterized protein n=1 Tax=Calocera cornea HHB12733 TaxID=1353952 RepID=A0A165C9L0_9BASI|nr:hypothetical protein CALCODRAFT_188357 [Calocera cornea HHB12733]
MPRNDASSTDFSMSSVPAAKRSHSLPASPGGFDRGAVPFPPAREHGDEWALTHRIQHTACQIPGKRDHLFVHTLHYVHVVLFPPSERGQVLRRLTSASVSQSGALQTPTIDNRQSTIHGPRPTVLNRTRTRTHTRTFQRPLSAPQPPAAPAPAHPGTGRAPGSSRKLSPSPSSSLPGRSV